MNVQIFLVETGTTINSFYTGNSEGDQPAIQVPTTGVYRLRVYGNQGDYAFRLLSRSTAANITFGVPVNINRTSSTEGGVYKISANAGDVLSMISTSTSSQWYLYTVDGTYISNSYSQIETKVPYTGEYVYSFLGNGADPLNTSFTVFKQAVTTQALTLGALTSGSLSVPEDKVYTFNGTAGQRLVFDSWDVDNGLSGIDLIDVDLLDPYDNVLRSFDSYNDVQDILLLDNGQHKLVIRQRSTSIAATGDFLFKLTDVGALTALNTQQSTASFTVSRTVTTGTASVNVATAPGTASSGVDYSPIAAGLTTLTFTPGQSSKTVVVPVIRDRDVETNETFFLNLSGAVGDTIADAQGVATVTNDDSNAAISVVGINNLQTTEVGGTASFSVVLNTAPTANVTIAVSSSDTTEGTVVPSSLVFTPANWNTAQTVTVTGVPDTIVDGNIGYQITLGFATSTDPNYNGVDPVDVVLNNIDNLTPFVESASVYFTRKSIGRSLNWKRRGAGSGSVADELQPVWCWFLELPDRQ